MKFPFRFTLKIQQYRYRGHELLFIQEYAVLRSYKCLRKIGHKLAISAILVGSSSVNGFVEVPLELEIQRTTIVAAFPITRWGGGEEEEEEKERFKRFGSEKSN